MMSLARLLPPKYRGAYAGREITSRQLESAKVLA
jgi:hypothetical protein